jgi:hypothetical protein
MNISPRIALTAAIALAPLLAGCANGFTQADPYAQRIADASVSCSRGDQHACVWYRKLVEAQGAWSNDAQQRAQQQAPVNALVAGYLLGTMAAPQMPTHIWVSPCTLNAQIARQC